MFRSDGERRSFSIVRDMTVIGRREDCDLRIPLGEVSRKHCRLVRDGDGLRLEDLGSSNGTYLNGVRVEREAVLNPGDSIQVGPVVFVLQLDGVPADEDLRPITVGAAGAAAAEADVTQTGGANGGVPPVPQEYSDDYTTAGAPIEGIGGEELDGLEPLPESEPEVQAGPGITELEPPAEPLGDDAGFDILMEENADGQPQIPMDLDLDAEHHQEQARPQQ